jgi:hypothetical protein
MMARIELNCCRKAQEAKTSKGLQIACDLRNNAADYASVNAAKMLIKHAPILDFCQLNFLGSPK